MLSKEAKDVYMFQFSDPYGILNLNAMKKLSEEEIDSLLVEPLPVRITTFSSLFKVNVNATTR